MKPVLAPWPGAVARAETPTIELDHRIQAEIPTLRRYLARLGGGGDTDDLVQETLTRALRSRRRFDPSVGSVWSWLRRTALRAWLDHVEQNARRPRGLGEHDLELPSTALSKSEWHERDEELRHMLKRLPESERQVLLRFHANGASVAQIATELRLPEGTVKSHLYRARRRLAQLGESR